MKWSGKVGAFEGAAYEAKGLYRSSADCIMFTRDSVGFCPVCRRAITRVIDAVRAAVGVRPSPSSRGAPSRARRGGARAGVERERSSRAHDACSVPGTSGPSPTSPSERRNATHRSCSASSRASDVAIGADRHVAELGPRGLVVRLDRRRVLRDRELEAHVGVQVAVGHVMHDLPHRPSARPIRRVELRIGGAADAPGAAVRDLDRSRCCCVVPPTPAGYERSLTAFPFPRRASSRAGSGPRGRGRGRRRPRRARRPSTRRGAPRRPPRASPRRPPRGPDAPRRERRVLRGRPGRPFLRLRKEVRSLHGKRAASSRR